MSSQSKTRTWISYVLTIPCTPTLPVITPNFCWATADNKQSMVVIDRELLSHFEVYMFV